jgi:hypothetical protein
MKLIVMRPCAWQLSNMSEGWAKFTIIWPRLRPGFVFDGERIPLINPQRGIFKPQQMRFLLPIKTVFPKRGGKVWYDDQRKVYRCLAASSTWAPSRLGRQRRLYRHQPDDRFIDYRL